MIVDHLNKLTKVVSELSNPSSISPLYRSFEIGPDAIRACSEYGNVLIVVDKTELDEKCLLNTAAVSAVTSSLPPASEIKLKKSGNSVTWSCGDAKGKWTIVQQEAEIPLLTHDTFPWTPSPEFPEALRLAASACQAAAVSIGLFGVTIGIIDGKLRLCSSNQIALAMSEVDPTDFPPTVSSITLRPPVPAVLSGILSSCPNCKMDITDDGIFIEGDWISCQLPLSPALTYNLNDIVAKYRKAENTAAVNLSAVKKFLARAKLLTDRHSLAVVGLEIENGKLVLKHAGIAAESEEYFLAEGLAETLNYKSVAIPIKVLLVPLSHVSSVVFDYLPDGILLLKGQEPYFEYVVGGK